MSQKYICNICSREFNSTQALGGHKGSHNRSKTRDSYVKSLKDLPCRNCQKIMLQPPWSKRVFCSVKCRGKYQTRISEENLTFNVRRRDLTDYQSKQHSCEICGKKEVVIRQENKSVDKLARDHNHISGNFRGLLCYSCNVKLGWYEKLSVEIVDYLNENNNFDNVKKKMGL